MKKPFVAVIGNKNSGKSTIIKSLTGAKTGQFRGTVKDLATKRTIEVIGSSPQEKELSPEELRKILKSAKSSSSCNGIVCALQPTDPRIRLSMEDVLKGAIDEGFSVYAFVLDPDYAGGSGQSKSVIARVSKMKIGVTKIDGRRFAHLNAVLINKKARLVG